MSDVTHQVNHPPTCTIHSPFTGGLESVVFYEVNMLCMHIIMSSSLVGSNSSGSAGVDKGRATNRLQYWQCGGIMHDMVMKLKKRSWCIPLSKAKHLQLYVALMQSF